MRRVESGRSPRGAATRALAACGLGAGALAACGHARTPAGGGGEACELGVRYREAANVFEILDNVSNWWPDKVDPEYREEWEKRFGVSPEDERLFAAYQDLRKHYYARPESAGEPERGAPPRLFAPQKPVDRIAAAFYDADTVAAALGALEPVLSKADAQTLRAFYAAFEPHTAALLEESRPYRDIATAMGDALAAPATEAYCRELADYYGVTELPHFTVLYVWWPPVDAVAANNRDRYLILKYNPVKHREGALRDVEIPVHEFSHYLSAHQPEAQKRALAQAFAAECDVSANLPPPAVLEEPLAVVHQKMFLEIVAPERFDLSGGWYGGNAWVSSFAKLAFAAVKKSHAAGGRLDAELMHTLGKTCAELKAVGRGFAR